MGAVCGLEHRVEHWYPQHIVYLCQCVKACCAPGHRSYCVLHTRPAVALRVDFVGWMVVTRSNTALLDKAADTAVMQLQGKQPCVTVYARVVLGLGL